MPSSRLIVLLALGAAASLLSACSDDPAPSMSTDQDADTDDAQDRDDVGDDAAPDAADAAEDTAPDAPDTTPDAPDAPTCAPLECEDFLNACAGPDCPVLSDYVPVVPGPGLPADVVTQNANNNLDVIDFEGRTWLAFRTGPFHFASADVVMMVISSDDLQTWRLETTLDMDTDLREPRLLAFDGRLFLYFAVLGTNPIDFEPQGMMVTERQPSGQWTTPAWFYGEGFIPWRTRTIDGVPHMITYQGGENIYDFTEGSVQVHWLTTTDGYAWTPIVPDQPIVLQGGASETDLALLDDGSLVAVARNELGDAETGWGSKICRATAAEPGRWQCVGDPRKFDSPIVFRHGPDVWLIARRNVTDTGYYDLGGDDLSPAERTRRNLLAYSNAPKRCALWRVHPDEQRVDFVLDLPSRGDTCFPGVVQRDAHTFHVYNYSSPPEGPDFIWLQGQGNHTLIYRVTLTFPAP